MNTNLGFTPAVKTSATFNNVTTSKTLTSADAYAKVMANGGFTASAAETDLYVKWV